MRVFFAVDNYLSIIPNPVKDIFSINAPSFTNATLTIYDITGRTIMLQPFNMKASIDILSLSNGVYIIELQNKDGVSLKGKFVKE